MKNPKALEYFTRILCKRLANMNKGEVMRGSTLTITVGAQPGLKGKSMIAEEIGEFACVSYGEGEGVAFFEGEVAEVAPYNI